MIEHQLLSHDQKNESALRAREKLREVIYHHSGRFSAEEAAEIGSLYLAYYTEVFLHIEDINAEGGDLQAAEGMRQRRFQLEAALFRAQEEGDYTLIKEELRRQAKAAKGSEKYDRWFGKYSDRLKSLAFSIRNRSKPFKPPAPAWVDAFV